MAKTSETSKKVSKSIVSPAKKGSRTYKNYKNYQSKALLFLDEIKPFNLTEEIYKLVEKLEERNNYDWQIFFGDPKELRRIFEELIEKADFVSGNISSTLFSSKSYWCGFLTAFPFDELNMEEESLLNIFKKENLCIIEDEEGLKLTFCNPSTSRYYRFFLKHKDGDGENISSSFNGIIRKLGEWIINKIGENPDSYGTWEEVNYTPEDEEDEDYGEPLALE